MALAGRRRRGEFRHGARRLAWRGVLAPTGERYRGRHRPDAVRPRPGVLPGKPFIQPKAPRLPAIDLGWWSSSPQVRAALEVNVLFIVGAVLAPVLLWALNNTRWGLAVRAVGDSADAARAMGYPVNRVRLLSTVAGGVFGGLGGVF